MSAGIQTAGENHDLVGGYSVILHHADPETSWERVSHWCIRARDEGVV